MAVLISFGSCTHFIPVTSRILRASKLASVVNNSHAWRGSAKKAIELLILCSSVDVRRSRNFGRSMDEIREISKFALLHVDFVVGYARSSSGVRSNQWSGGLLVLR